MLLYAMILGLSLVLACIKDSLGNQAANVFVTNTQTMRVLSDIVGASVAIRVFTLAHNAASTCYKDRCGGWRCGRFFVAPVGLDRIFGASTSPQGATAV